MKKIGIMSMQRINNYGSFMQAYGLKKTIEMLVDSDVEFVDYHVGAPLIKKEKNGRINKIINLVFQPGKLSHKLKYVKYKKRFKEFVKKLGVSNEYNYNPTLDTLVIGSDEVFNCIQSNTNVGYSLELFGENNNAKHLISYAASFGNTTLEKITTYGKKEEIADALAKFDSISVRDKNSNDIILDLIGLKPNINIDPVLLYGYDEIIDEYSVSPIREKYIVLYAYSGRISKNEAKIIKKIAKEKKLKIVSIGGVQYGADYFVSPNPFEVLSYFKFAEYIITDTFHGSIFSIICKKNFTTIIRRSSGNNYGNEEKLTYLLNTFCLDERIVYEVDTNIIKKDINYDLVAEILEQEKNKSINYLKSNL